MLSQDQFAFRCSVSMEIIQRDNALANFTNADDLERSVTRVYYLSLLIEIKTVHQVMSLFKHRELKSNFILFGNFDMLGNDGLIER